MQQLERILAVLDPTAEAQPALAKAAQLAEAAGAALELFVCDFEPALANSRFLKSGRLETLRHDYLAGHEAVLERHAVALRDRGLTVTTHVRWDKAVHQGIVARAREWPADLVVKDTHYHGLIRRTVLTNTDWNLIRTCPAPLLLAKPEPWHKPPRVLAAVDPGHEDDPGGRLDDAILEHGAALARELDGELHVVHAFFPAELIASASALAAAPAVDTGGIVQLVDEERSRVRQALSALAARHSIAPGQVHFKQGAATHVLCDSAAELPADIVVLGAIARGRVQEMLLGSTAERVLDRIVSDILVVKVSAAVATTG
jgi:universal stress protein E